MSKIHVAAALKTLPECLPEGQPAAPRLRGLANLVRTDVLLPQGGETAPSSFASALVLLPKHLHFLPKANLTHLLLKEPEVSRK